MDGGAAATVTVQTGAAIEGRVSLGAGADELILAGGDFSKITTIDGGSGDDTLRITAGSGAFAPAFRRNRSAERRARCRERLRHA